MALLLVRQLSKWKSESTSEVSSGLRSLNGSLFAETLGMHLKNSRMVDQAVNGGNGHHRIGKDALPLTKRLIRRDQEALALIAVGNEFKQHRGFRL